jgi:integrase
VARHIWDHDLSNRTRRLKLDIRKKPYSIRLGNGVNLQYQRNKGPGSWLVAVANGKGGQTTHRLATSDDYEEANSVDVLAFNEAQDRARLFGRFGAGATGSSGPVTLRTALDHYAKDLTIRNRDPKNADRVRKHASELLDHALVALTPRHFADWRNRVAGKETPQNFNRIAKAFAAALALQARLDKRLDARVWKDALKNIPGARRSRNIVHKPAVVARVVKCAYAHNHAYGVLIEVLASSGSRPSQARRLTVGDLHRDRVLMPRSHKGGGIKERTHVPVPIVASLARKLHAMAADRPADAPLLVRDDGSPWTKDEVRHYWDVVATAAEIGTGGMYSLRHSAITNMLLKGLPVRTVAELCDTSTREIEATYGSAVTHHADEMLRAALPNFDAGDDDRVVPMRR